MINPDLSRLAICVGAVLLASAVGSFATVRAIPTWYKGLAKPSFNPPEWLFGPAWTVLYLLMAVAAFLVWKQGIGVPGVKLALAVFLVQLALNALWSILFFRVSVPAGVMLLPYIGWVSFAALLNAAILRLNR